MEPNINTELAKELVLEARKCYQNKNAQDGLILLEKAKDIFIGARDYEHYIEAENLMGVIYSTVGNDSMAIDIYLDCLELARKKRLHQYMAISFNNIGSRYQALGQHDKAIEYFLKAQAEMYKDRIPGREQPGSLLLTLYLNIQESYGRLGEYDKALKYLEMTSTDSLLMSWKPFLSGIQINMTKYIALWISLWKRRSRAQIIWIICRISGSCVNCLKAWKNMLIGRRSLQR